MSRLRIATIIALFVTMGSAAAMAQESANIVVANTIVARIRTGGSCGSLSAREALISQRIVEALSNELPNIFSRAADGANITVLQSGGLWTLKIGSVTLIQVYPQDAAPAGISTKQLALQWKENFRKQLPRAVAPSKVPQWWKDAHPEAAPAATGGGAGLPAEDTPLVHEVVAILDAARAMSAQQYEALQENVQRAMLERIWSYRRAECGPPPEAIYIRIKSALEKAREAQAGNWAIEKEMVAGVTIAKTREYYHIPGGIGPVPAERPLPDFEVCAVPAEPVTPIGLMEPEPIAAPRLVPGTPLREVQLGTGLDANNQLLDAGQQFIGDILQILVVLQVQDAAPNTIVGVTLQREGQIVGRRLLRVSGEQRLAVSFYPSQAETMPAGDYLCKLTVNGTDAGEIPFRIAAPAASMIEG